jgi:hypothetical protein
MHWDHLLILNKHSLKVLSVPFSKQVKDFYYLKELAKQN